jgi:Rrf2 family cysteine metabolism transcriptional repressor
VKLSTRGRYALRMMVAIARRAERDTPVSLDDVSNITSISKRYLEQVAMGLKGAGLLRGVRGRSGGYLLTRKPNDITVGEIVEASIGPINVVDCVLDPESCPQVDACATRWVYERINTGITDVLNGLVLQDLLDHQSNGSVPTDTCPDVEEPASDPPED